MTYEHSDQHNEYFQNECEVTRPCYVTRLYEPLLRKHCYLRKNPECSDIRGNCRSGSHVHCCRVAVVRSQSAVVSLGQY